MSREEYERAIDIEAIRGERLNSGRDISAGELRALFASCHEDKSVVGIRDAVMIALLYGGGMRRAEVAGLVLKDWQPDKRQVIVLGKGNKEREVPLPTGSLSGVRLSPAIR